METSRTYSLQSLFIRLVPLASVVLVCCQFASAQSADEVLTKCRDSFARISSFEYSAASKNNRGETKLFFVAKDGEAYQYNNGEVKTGHDGIYYFRKGPLEDVEKIHSPPNQELFLEPFQTSFFWLTSNNGRNEILRTSRWEEFLHSNDTLVSREQIEGHECAVLTSRRMGAERFQIAFGEDVGYLPVRVRRLDEGSSGRSLADYTMSDFKHLRVNEIDVCFPTKFTSRTELGEISKVTKIRPGTLRVNVPIDVGLLRLEYDSVKFEQMKAAGNRQEWFSDEIAEMDRK